MTVGELREALEASWPDTAVVVVRVRRNVAADGGMEELFEFRDEDPDAVIRAYDTVIIQLDE